MHGEGDPRRNANGEAALVQIKLWRVVRDHLPLAVLELWLLDRHGRVHGKGRVRIGANEEEGAGLAIEKEGEVLPRHVRCRSADQTTTKHARRSLEYGGSTRGVVDASWVAIEDEDVDGALGAVSHRHTARNLMYACAVRRWAA